MFRVKLFGPAALVVLLSACGGGSSGGSGKTPANNPSRDDLSTDDLDTIGNAIDANGGTLDGVPVKLPDGSTVIVSGVDPTTASGGAGYLLVGTPNANGDVVGIANATLLGAPYKPAQTPTGRYDYSGENRAYLKKGGNIYDLFKGKTNLTLDFGNGTGSIDATGTADTGARTRLTGDVRLDPKSGALGTTKGKPLDLSYTAGGTTTSHEAGLFGSVNGANEGFSALYEAVKDSGVQGVGVTTGARK